MKFYKVSPQRLKGQKGSQSQFCHSERSEESQTFSKGGFFAFGSE
jgi:hypothetical protein